LTRRNHSHLRKADIVANPQSDSRKTFGSRIRKNVNVERALPVSNEFNVVPPVRVSLSCHEQLDSFNLRTKFNLELDLAGNVNIEQVHLAMHRDEIT
jgi:hypothetical protein